jgi:hypothetical protein
MASQFAAVSVSVVTLRGFDGSLRKRPRCLQPS